MSVYINIPLKEGETERDRFNHVNMNTLERQLTLLSAMMDGFELKGQEEEDAEGLRRLVTRILVDLKLGNDTTLFVR
jgi:hypothetical protein